MTFKEEGFKEEWWKIDRKLRWILCDVDYFLQRFHVELFITCLIRSDAEQQKLFESGESKYKVSVHQFGRGADARNIDNPTISQALLDYVNARYVYDPSRPEMKTVIQHEGTAKHFHFQTVEEG